MTNFDNNEINTINSISITLNDLSHNCLNFLKNRLNISNNDFNNYILNDKLCKLNNSKSPIFTLGTINLSKNTTPKTKVINTKINNQDLKTSNSNEDLTIDNDDIGNVEELSQSELDVNKKVVNKKKDKNETDLVLEEDDNIKSKFTKDYLELFKSLCLYNYGKGYVLVPPYKHPFIGKEWWSDIDTNFDEISKNISDNKEIYGGWWKSTELSFKNCWFFKESYLYRLKELDVRFFIEKSYKNISKPKIYNNNKSISLQSLKKLYNDLNNAAINQSNDNSNKKINDNEKSIQKQSISSKYEKDVNNVQNDKISSINNHLKNNKNILTIHSNNLEYYFNQNVKNIEQYNFGFLIEFLNKDQFKDKKCMILSYNSELYYGLFNESLNKYYFPICDITCDFFKFLSKEISFSEMGHWKSPISEGGKYLNDINLLNNN